MTRGSFSVVHRRIWREEGTSEGAREIAEECATALSYNGSTYAVMMATPQDLNDFAIGFSLNEGIIRSVDEIESIEQLSAADGVELRMWLVDSTAKRLRGRIRRIAGPTGCGLCGVESIEEALRPAAQVGDGGQFSPECIMSAMRALSSLQLLNMRTRAVHGAAFWTGARGVVALREDVGRHNALDKLAGALVQTDVAPTDGMVLLTSRVSVEMVQKTASIGATVIASISAPTALAVRVADDAGITLVAIAREDGFEVFTHPWRIWSEEDSHRVLIDDPTG